MAGNMRRDIEVANGQEDYVSEAIQIAISRGAIFDGKGDGGNIIYLLFIPPVPFTANNFGASPHVMKNSPLISPPWSPVAVSCCG